MHAATPDATSTISVWIVEDDVDYRKTIEYLFDHTSGFKSTEVFYAYEEIESLLDETKEWTHPDVVLMDIGLPGMDGIEGVSRLKNRLPDVPIVMLTVRDEADLIFKAFRAGASGYLLKDTGVDRIVAALREAVAGGTLMPAPVASKVLQFFSQKKTSADYALTPREKEILDLMADGLAHKAIAERLYLSPYTVENHLRSIYQKLHVSSGIEAVSKAFRERLI